MQEMYDDYIILRNNLNFYLRMQKSGRLNSNSRNSSALNYQESALNHPLTSSTFRLTSPKSKTKIRLVSPMRANMQSLQNKKENYAPAATTSNFYTQKSSKIELGGKKTASKQPSNINNASVRPPSTLSQNTSAILSQSNFKKPQIQVVNATPIMGLQSPVRVASPPKICINNKWFDMGSIRSQVVYVAPLNHIRLLSSTEQVVSQAWPTQLVIQEENALQELKECYESELNEIKQLHHEIEENNLQIKQLLKSSRVSRELDSSRHKHSSSQNSQKQLIQEKPITQISSPPLTKAASKSSTVQMHDEVSVQTENTQSIQRFDNRIQKFCITRSKECQIQLICAAEKDKQQEIEMIESRAREYLEQTQSQLFPLYAVNINLKSSRAGSKFSEIRYSQQQIEFKHVVEAITPRLGEQFVKSTASIASVIEAKKQYSTPKGAITSQEQTQKHSQKKVSLKDQGKEVTGSVNSTGKRRINNNIYL